MFGLLNSMAESKENKLLEKYYEDKYTRNSKWANILNPELTDEEILTPRFNLQLKLVAITSAILFIVSVVIISIATYFFKKDTEIRLKENELKLIDILSSSISLQFSANIQYLTENYDQFKKQNLKELKEKKENLIYFVILEKKLDTYNIKNQFKQKDFFEANEIDEKVLEENILTHTKKNTIVPDYVLIKNASLGQKNILYLIDTQFNNKNERVIGVFSTKSLSKLFERKSINKLALVSEDGKIIFHPDPEKIFLQTDISNTEIFTQAIQSKLGNGQIHYKENNEKSIGTFKSISISNLFLISTVSEEILFEEVYRIRNRNILILIICISVSIGLIFLFAKTISKPVLTLLRATSRIAKGDFKILIEPEYEDEIGLLTENFITMSKGLEEREKIKDAFGRFVNPVIVERIASGTMDLDGEEKSVAILFCDIRGFTPLSENLEPHELVEFLNEYLTIMVECVEMTFGIVDKFIGDAIMATWGALPSIGNPAENAINTALLMRFVLEDYNLKREKAGKKRIRNGCGLNFGPVVAGQIGSVNKMEFTVIGDAVNLASRVESLTKEFRTDILITESLFNEVKEIYLVEKMEEIYVKGKSKPQTVYAVISRKDSPDKDYPKTLNELRTVLKIPSKEINNV